MMFSTLQKAAAQFGTGEPAIESLGSGLIHRTYKASYPGTEVSVVLQCLNQTMFPQPENIINNYRVISQYLNYHPDAFKVPEMVLTHSGKLYWIDEEENFWRATVFVNNSYTPSALNSEKEASAVALTFARYCLYLSGLGNDLLDIVIPDFHNLSLRYHQFESAIEKATIQRLLKSTHVIAELRQRKFLVDFFEKVKTNDQYKTRIMHHDCKISNILVDKVRKKVICPVDLDTTMPGYFFSDIGDMIRSMAGTVDENSTRWEDIGIRKNYYKAIVDAYLEVMGNSFSLEERNNIHYAGPLLIYMQAVRFVTDFLNNDIYYKTTYPEQNLNRALNQLILLEKMEEFLQSEYDHNFRH